MRRDRKQQADNLLTSKMKKILFYGFCHCVTLPACSLLFCLISSFLFVIVATCHQPEIDSTSTVK